MSSLDNLPNPPGCFITGTDTEVGKTYVGACMAKQLVAAGRKVGVYKPLASGCIQQEGQWASGDALALWQAAGQPRTLQDVCPQVFIAPLAPHVAAREEGRGVDRELLRTGIEPWQAESDFLIVEGAGGLLCPLGDEDFYMADLAGQFGYPLVLVARNALGTINHTLLTIEVAVARGLKIAAIVVNHLIEADDHSTKTNVAEIRQRARSYGIEAVVELNRNGESFQPQPDWLELSSPVSP